MDGTANLIILLSIFHPLFKNSIKKAIIHNGKLTTCVIPPVTKMGNCERQEKKQAPYNIIFTNFLSFSKTLNLLGRNSFMLVVFIIIQVLLLNNSLLSQNLYIHRLSLQLLFLVLISSFHSLFSQGYSLSRLHRLVWINNHFHRQ